MKITNIFLIAILSLAVSITNTSCDDELSALPTQSKVEGNVIVDQKSAKAALNGIFYKFAQCGTDVYGVKSTKYASNNELIPANIAGLISFTSNSYLEIHGSQFYSMLSSSFWNTFYSQIASINGVIDQLNQANDAWFEKGKKQEMIGEAYCMRAIVNYNILRFYGYSWDINSPYGIIIKTEATSNKNLSTPRSSVKDSYDAILKDLDLAISTAPDINDNYYINKWVALGQKVRVLMLRGQGDDYKDAAEIADNIIKNSPYELETLSTDIFQTKGLASKEVMFGIKPQEAGGLQSDNMESYVYHGTPQWTIKDNFIKLFDNDPRKDKIINTVTSKDYVYIYDDEGHFVGAEIKDITRNIPAKHYLPGKMSPSVVEETNVCLRLTEIYLLRAEALVKSQGIAGLPTAKELLKIVMQHAGITDFKQFDTINDVHDFYQAYFNEYIKNMFCESGREIDIMYRLPQDIVAAFNPEYYSEGKQNFGLSLFAIPNSEFLHNKELKETDQNPGYASK